MNNRQSFIRRPAARALRLPVRPMLPRLAPSRRQQGLQEERLEQLLRYLWGRLGEARRREDILVIEALLASSIFDDEG